MTEPERPCRCPACNPIHHGKRGGHIKRSFGEKDCTLCKNTRRVPQGVAERYMGAHTGMTVEGDAGRQPETAKPQLGDNGWARGARGIERGEK